MAPLPTLFLVALVGRFVAQALDCHVCTYSGENCFKPMCCLAVVTYGTTTDLLHPNQDEGEQVLCAQLL